MSRIHSNQPTAQELFLYNTENFLSKMMRNKRVERPRTELKINRDKSANRNNNQLAVSRTIAKPGPVMKIEEPKRKPSAQELVHKEVFNNNMATVEVTVRTVAPKAHDGKVSIEDEKETWGKILTVRKSEENIQNTFGSFDPLRTLHFLSKELQQKLQHTCPADPGIQQIVFDMQNAVQRLPPDILTQFKGCDDYVNDNEFSKNSKKVDPNLEDKKVSKQCQTIIIGDAEAKRMQEQLEESATKLEANCKEMENVCNKLKSEKEDLESKLLSERETVTSLRKELLNNVSEKEEKMKDIETLTSERDALKKQIIEVQAKLEAQAGPSAEDLRFLVDELRNKQVTYEQENTTRRNDLTMMKLERDKMNVLLDCKDKQLRELRSELECIQQLVSSQLLEYKAKPTFSSTSTVLSSATQLWNVPSTAKGKSVHELFLNSDIMRKMLMNKEVRIADSGTITTLNVEEMIKDQNMKLDKSDLQEVPQRDEVDMNMKSEMIIGDLHENVFMPKMSSPSIKDMFAEIKRQAFKKLDVNLPSSSSKSKEVEDEIRMDSRASLSS